MRCQDTETTRGYEKGDIRDTLVVSKFPLRSRVLPSEAELPLRQLSAWLAYSFDNALNVKVSVRSATRGLGFSLALLQVLQLGVLDVPIGGDV